MIKLNNLLTGSSLRTLLKTLVEILVKGPLILYIFLNLFYISSFYSDKLWAEEQTEYSKESVESSFNLGIAAARAENWNEAIKNFNYALGQSPNNLAILSNLAYSHFKLGQIGYAAAYYRKVLHQGSGSLHLYSEYSKVLEQIQSKALPHEIEIIEILRNSLLIYIDAWIFYFLTGLFFILSGWNLLKDLGARRRTHAAEAAPPRIPIIGYLTLGLFFISAILVGLKEMDQHTIRGTIISSEAPARAAPGEDQVELFTLLSGHEVVLKRQQGEWYQVQYPGGATGWIKNKDLLLTN